MKPQDHGGLQDMPEERRCTAVSERTGEQCKRWAMRGSTVCVKHSANVADDQQANAGGGGEGSGSGSPAAPDERDRALALRELRKLARSSTTADAVKVQALKILAGVEEQVSTAKPPPIAALEGMSSADRQRLIATLV